MLDFFLFVPFSKVSGLLQRFLRNSFMRYGNTWRILRRISSTSVKV